MKKMSSVFILLSFAFLSSSFAQNQSDGFDQRLQRYQSIHGELIKYLKKVGHPSVGYYPFCSDLIRLYQEEQETITSLLYKKHEMTFEDLEVQLDWASLSEKQTPHYKDEVAATPIGFVKTSGGGFCFDKKTPIQTLMLKKGLDSSRINFKQTADYIELLNRDMENKVYWKNANFILSQVEFEKLQSVTSNTYTSHTPYILSSSYAVIPDERYQKDCWSRINQIYYAQVEHDKFMSEIIVQVGGLKRSILSTENHRFLSCDGNDTSKCQWVRAKDLSVQSKLHHGDETNVSVAATKKYKVDDSWMGFENDRAVYNLSTETFTYYVGMNDTRVLVHNVK